MLLSEILRRAVQGSYATSLNKSRLFKFLSTHLSHRWRSLQTQSVLFRWPIKMSIFGLVLFGVLYPDPFIFARHLQNLNQVNQLPDASADLGAVSTEFEQFLSDKQIDVRNTAKLLAAAEEFVYHRIPYAWDWESWGVADYLPTVREIVAKGREDCDGRAVLAAALLRERGVDARLVGDPRHMWVSTPNGELMDPTGPAAIRFEPTGVQVRWLQLLDPGPAAFGVSVFPFGREIIILITLWALLLPARVPRIRALFSFILLLGALLLLRDAGVNPRLPQYGQIGLAVSFIFGAWCVLSGPLAIFENMPFRRSVAGAFNGAG